MGKFQIIVLLSVVTCAIITTVQSVPVSDSSVESENAAKCKKLCGFCGCTGYYCGDECLCECNSLTDGEAECVDTMKSNCKKLELPFEVLIQGPNVNRMVRSLLYADPAEEDCCESSESKQKKRSTISIYKPDAIQQQDAILAEPAVPKIEVQETQKDDSPITIIAEPLDTKVDQVVQETQTKEKNMEDAVGCSLMPSPDDGIDRTNIKQRRHTMDVNQEITELSRDSDDSFLYKREIEVEKEKKEEVPTDEAVAAPAAPVPVPASAPVPVVPAPLMPRFHDAIERMRAQIPTSAEIRSAWEGVRSDLNTRINSAIADAKVRAADLRNRIVPPVVAPPAPPAPARLNPFLKAENEENDVGMALVPAVPLIPVISPIQTEIAKNIAATRAAATPIQTEFAKNIATFRINNKLIQDNARAETRELINALTNNRWLVNPSLLVGSTHEEVEEEKKEEEKKEEEKKEAEKKEKEPEE